MNSHSVRNLLKKHGWGHRVTDAEETLVSPEVMRTAPEEPSADEEEFPGADDHAIENSATFAYESHLRDFLANHLEILEPGLPLWGDDAVEYPVGTRRIDVHANRRDGVPVVIELKVRRGHERTVGQSLYYRAKLKEMMSRSRVRIIIVASEISPELKLASSEMNDLTLYEYSLSMTVSRVRGVGAKAYASTPRSREGVCFVAAAVCKRRSDTDLLTQFSWGRPRYL